MLTALANIFTYTVGTGTAGGFLLCCAAALLMGLVIAWAHMFRNRYSKNFVVTLAILPMLVGSVILLVNGNLGTGVAVMGAFSLVRFRSIPGNSREISSIFLAMSVGLAVGTGYLGIAGLLVLMAVAASLALNGLHFGEQGRDRRHLKITVPENIDFQGVFEEVLENFTKEYHLTRIRTTNMGSLFELDYQIVLRDVSKVKDMMDALRCRNGNLSIVCNYGQESVEEL